MISETNRSQLANLLYNLAWIRKSCGISKRQMSALLGISIGTLNKIEKGEVPPRMSAEVLIKVQTYFCLRMQDLLERRLGE